MSPGITFERVYRELKLRLADGTLKAGEPIEPAAISAELAASITPIRDALHRLVGERLVEAPNHNGFRVPRPSEAELRDLYLWNGWVLGLAIRLLRPGMFGATDPARSDMETGLATADRFLRIARAAGREELVRTIAQLNDRLAPYRRAESHVLDGLAEELDGLDMLLRMSDRARTGRAVSRYHQRRAATVSDILAILADKG